MPSIEFDDDRPPRSRHELLAQVRRDGLRRRYRRRAGVAGVCVLLVGALLAPAVLGAGSGDSRQVVALEEPLDSTVVEETTTTSSVLAAETTTTAAVPSATTTTVPLVCRNSTDPRCGDFRWDPDPGPNEPLTVEVRFTPPQPRAGETVTFTVVSVDPDAAPILNEGCGPYSDFGEGELRAGRCLPACDSPGWGPWSPPPKERGERTEMISHTYSEPGTYQVQFGRISVASCGAATNPYAGSGYGEATVTVAP